ncbi:ABC transporter substrate-binding protein [Ferrovibrio xuzhouensis]|uniref:ABC transporter substrate-binding protein n=1 Tax=Ferrovibrio xuzhouensis TaxID=1576914 RepID=A0ABV7VLL5_9PROT
MRKLFLGVAGAALALMTATGAWAGDPGVTDKEIKLGSFLPLQSGLSAGASQYRDGMESYLKYINDQGGINGRKIVWEVENDSYNPQQAVAAAKKLVDRDGVFLIVGTLGTTNTLATIPFLKQRNVPLLGPLGSHPSINKPEDRIVFPISPLGTLHGVSLAQFAHKDLKAKRIGVFYQDDQYGKELLEGAREFAKKNGMEIVSTQSYVPSDVDVSPQALAISQTKPDAVIMAVIPKQGALFLKEAQKMGWKTNFLAPQLMGDPVAVDLAGSAIEGLYVNLYAAIESMDTPMVKLANQVMAKYAPNTPVGYWSYIGMAGAVIFEKGARKAGKNLTRESLMAALESIGKVDAGVIPPVDYTKGAHSGPVTFGYAQVQGGKLKLIHHWNE